MDLERAMEFLLEQQATLATQTTAQQARFDAQIAKIDERLDRLAAAQEKTQSQADRTEAALRRAVRMSVEEHRREWVRRHRLEDAMRQLAIAQASTQETLKAFMDSMKQPRNGHDTV